MSKKERSEHIDLLVELKKDSGSTKEDIFLLAVEIIADQEAQIKDLSHALAKSERKRAALMEMINHSAERSAGLRTRVKNLQAMIGKMKDSQKSVSTNPVPLDLETTPLDPESEVAISWKELLKHIGCTSRYGTIKDSRNLRSSQ